MVHRSPWPHAVPPLLAAGLVAAALCCRPGPAAAQPANDPDGAVDGMETMFGATPLVAQSGNGRMTVGITLHGDVAVLRWPSTTHWDHLRYRTANGQGARDRPLMGARPNDGILWGVRPTGQDAGVSWLHDGSWQTAVTYAGDTSAQVVTTAARGGAGGLSAEGRDVVLLGEDVLVRSLRVQGLGAGGAVVAWLNLAPHTDTKPFLPIHEVDDVGRLSRVAWDGAAGTGQWTLPGGAEGVGFRIVADPAPDGWQCARDGAADEGWKELKEAGGAPLSGVSEFEGQATLALLWNLPAGAGGQGFEVRLLLAAGETPPAPPDPGTVDERVASGDAAWQARIDGLHLPATDDPELLAFSRRTLMALLQGVDAATGAIVASASQQPPYHLDWPRDGAFFNAALVLAGDPELVARRNRFYARVQRTADGQDRFLASAPAPAGSWAMNYHSDGTPGGPIDFEIDEVGFMAWSLGRLGGPAGAAENRAALERAAALLAGCRDDTPPEEGGDPRLQCAANEDDNPAYTRTLHGAEAVLLGLRSARDAGVAGLDARIAELEAAIEEVFWDEAAGHFSADLVGSNAWAVWPVRLWPRTDQRWAGVADRLVAHVRERLLERRPGGSSYDAKATLALAHLWPAGDAEPRRAELEAAIRVLATEVAMPGTRHLGEVYMPAADGGWSNRVSQPHLWQQTLVYLSLLELYEPGLVTALSPDPPGMPAGDGSAGPDAGCLCAAGPAGRTPAPPWAFIRR